MTGHGEGMRAMDDKKNDKTAEQGKSAVWDKINDEAEMLRSRTTPVYKKQRIMDALQSFPPLILLILIVSVNPLTNGPNLLVIAFALGLVGIPSVQRIVRGVVLSTREQQYVEAARVIGASDIRTMRYYIVPNIMASIIVVFSTGLGVAILAESALGFIAPDKLPTGTSWGVMLGDEQNVIGDHPIAVFAPAAAIAFSVLGFNLAGDALRDVLDPRLRL